MTVLRPKLISTETRLRLMAQRPTAYTPGRYNDVITGSGVQGYLVWGTRVSGLGYKGIWSGVQGYLVCLGYKGIWSVWGTRVSDSARVAYVVFYFFFLKGALYLLN